MGTGQQLLAGLAFCGALLFTPIFADDNGTCPPLRGVVLHPQAIKQGYTISVGVAGTPRTFLLAFGQAYSKLDQAIATDLKLPLEKAAYTVTDGISTFPNVAKIPSLSLGAITRGESEVFVGPRNQTWGNADGVAGMNMFAGFDVELDLAHNRLGLYLTRDCPFHPFWTTDGVGEASFITEKTGRIVVPMKLDDVEIEADFRIDQPLSKMPLEAARILFGDNTIERGLSPAGVDEYNQNLFSFPFKTLTGGEKVTITNPRVLIVEAKGNLCSGVAGRAYWKGKGWDRPRCLGGGDLDLGGNLLRQLHLFFSYKDNKIYFTKAELPDQPTSPGAPRQ